MLVEHARSGLGRLSRTARADRWTVPGFATMGLAGAATVVTVAVVAHVYGFADLALQVDALHSWRNGDGLYAYLSVDTHLGYALPPVAALAQLPAAALPLPVVGWLTALAGVAALLLALIALVGPVARRHGRRRWVAVAAAGPLVLLIEPIRACLGLGHLDLLLFGLVTADVVALRRRAWARRRAAWWPGRPAATAVHPMIHAAFPPLTRPDPAPAAGTRRLVNRARDLLRHGWSTGGWAGVGVGLATALGVSPVIFIGYLAVTRQWRATLTALGTATIAVGGAFLLMPGETAAWLGGVLWRIDRTGTVDSTANQSLAGVLARLYDSTTTPILLWLAFASLLLAVGVIRARSAHADGDEITAFTLVGLTSCVIGPVAATYELIWVVPAMVILVDVAARRRLASRIPSRRGLLDGWRPSIRASRMRPGGGGPLRHLPSLIGIGPLAAAGAAYLIFVTAPVWAYEHRLPATSHRADGLLGTLGENTFALVLILLVTALPWRPGAAPAFPSYRWASPARRRIPPARRPLPSDS